MEQLGGNVALDFCLKASVWDLLMKYLDGYKLSTQ